MDGAGDVMLWTDRVLYGLFGHFFFCDGWVCVWKVLGGNAVAGVGEWCARFYIRSRDNEKAVSSQFHLVHFSIIAVPILSLPSTWRWNSFPYDSE